MLKVPYLNLYENLEIYKHKYRIINKTVITYNILINILADH